MELEMDNSTSLSFYHHHPPPFPSPSLGQADAAFPYHYYYYHPPNSITPDGFHIPAAAAAAPPAAAEPNNPPAAAPPASSRRRSRVRVARKDERHSKIWTASGMRDRRMRLSMEVARRFFSLQDKLGFDKASKTVQWLLDMSKAGINDLAAAAAATTTSEDGSVLLQDHYNNDLHTMADSSERNKHQIMIGSKSNLNLKRKNMNEPSTKESRAEARERARERTRERNCLRWLSSVPTVVVDQAEAPPPPAAAAAACSYNIDEQQQDQPWELSGVVFAKAHRFHHSAHHG